jgi:hypothetical protein
VKRVRVLAVAAGCGVVGAEVPKFDGLFPAGGRLGTEFVVTVAGKVGEDCRWWTDAPGVTFKETEKPEEWQLRIGEETPPGHYLIVLHHEVGAAPARWFSIGRLPEIREEEPNDEVGKGQPVGELPVCVNGRLNKAGDVDGYEVALRAGETLVGMVEAYALGSPVDMLAHVVNPRGERVATFSDGRNLDPMVVFTAPTDGVYTVQLAGFSHPPAANVQFAGGDALVYRLHLSRGAVATHLHPAVRVPGEVVEMELRGLHLGEDLKRWTPGEDGGRGDGVGEVVALDVPHALTPLQVLSHGGPLIRPVEGKLVPPGVYGGLLARGEERHEIEMQKGERMEARVWAQVLGSPLDAALRVLGPDGKELANVDDHEGGADPLVTWTAAVDGGHALIVSDVLGGDGFERPYVLSVGEPRPWVRAVFADPKPLVLESGKSVKVKVNVKRSGEHEAGLELRLEDLPEGVEAAAVEVPEKGGEVEVELTAAGEAVPFNGPIRAVVRVPGEGGRVEAVASAPLRGDLARGTSLLDEARWLWLTVRSLPAAEPNPE